MSTRRGKPAWLEPAPRRNRANDTTTQQERHQMAGKKKPGTALATWDEQLAQQAEVAAGMEKNVAGGQFFSLRSATLSFNDAPITGNRMAVIILDGIMENVYYEGEFNADQANSPSCFAFGRDESTIAPHESVVAAGQAQHEQCQGCPHNEWGTADRGRGKACRNTRRLGLISAGNLDERSGAF